MNPRQVKIRRALLLAAQAIPEGLLLPEDLLRAEAGRLVVPKPTTSELDQQIEAADAGRQLIGISTDEGVKWKLSAAGRAWLTEHP